MFFVCMNMQWWAVRGSRAFSAGPIKIRLFEKCFIYYLGIIFICVMSTSFPVISLVEAELEYPSYKSLVQHDRECYTFVERCHI